MYFENAEKFLTDLGFKKHEECKYFLKINEKQQLFVFSTDKNEIMFISEHEILEPNNLEYEENYDNINILSEYVLYNDFADVLYKYDLISENYKNLFYLKTRILHKLNDKNFKDEFSRHELEEFNSWIDIAFYHMKDEGVAVFVKDEEIPEFIEIANEELNAD